MPDSILNLNLYPAGAAVGTPDDFLRFAQSLVPGTGIVIMTNQYNEFVFNQGLPEQVFGKINILQNKADDSSRAVGLYYPSRTIKQGPAGIYNVLNLRMLRNIDAGDIVITREARFSEQGGVKRISSAYGEILEADAYVCLGITAVLLYIVAVVWSVINLLYRIIKLIIEKIRRSGNQISILMKLHYIECGYILISVAGFQIIVAIFMSWKASPAKLFPVSILNIVLAALPLVYAVLLFVKRKTDAAGKKHIRPVVTTVMGLFLSIAIFVFQLYRWW